MEVDHVVKTSYVEDMWEVEDDVRWVIGFHEYVVISPVVVIEHMHVCVCLCAAISPLL